MITDSDIIRILSDERLDRKILATIRRALRAPDEPGHVSESDKPLPATWGMIPIRDAARKYKLTMEELATLIAERKCKGTATHVDEDSLQMVVYDGRKRGLPPKELDGAEFTDEDEAARRAYRKRSAPQEAAPSSLSMAEAAARLGISEENVAEHLLAGSLRAVGEDRVAERSVVKFEQVLRPVSPAAPAPTAPVPQEITYAEAAARLGVATGNLKNYLYLNRLERTRRGYVSEASVQAYLKTRGKKTAPGKPVVDPATPPGDAMTTAQAAQRLGITPSNVSQLTSVGQLVRVSRGHLSVASVEAMREKRLRKGLLQEELVNA